MEKELRMYGFVNYQLTGIQKGIQFAHSIVEYGLENFNTDEYLDWAKNWKTVILLNGGTTNNNPDSLGSINKTYNSLKENKVVCSSFSEPDLGDQMTSISFIVDERVFNKKKYPDVDDWIEQTRGVYIENDKVEFEKSYIELVTFIGGEKNLFLRDFLKNFGLA